MLPTGIALFGTIHWLFDRRFMLLTDDLGLLVAGNWIPTEPLGRFEKQRAGIIASEKPSLRAHPPFIRGHRARFMA